MTNSIEAPGEREAERIAKGLTETQLAAIPKLIGAWGLPRGHNAWPLIEYEDVDGDDAMRLLSLDVLEAVEPEDGSSQETLVGDGDEIPDVEPRWFLQLTPLGQAVRDYLSRGDHIGEQHD